MRVTWIRLIFVGAGLLALIPTTAIWARPSNGKGHWTQGPQTTTTVPSPTTLATSTTTTVPPSTTTSAPPTTTAPLPTTTTSPPPPTTAAPTPSTCTGVPVGSGASVQGAINSSPAGTTFCISGSHSITTAIFPLSGDRLIGTPGAVIDGGNVATVGIDGNNANNVTVSGLVIQHINNASQISAVGRNNEGSGWTIEGNEVAFNATEGIFVGAYATVRMNHVHDNGQLGISGYESDNAIVAGNEVDHNGAPQYVTFEGGGIKLYKGTNVTVSNNNVHDNDGSGIWLDTDVVNSMVTANTLTNNADAIYDDYGIEIEITCNVTVSNNTITGTASEGRAIMVSSSHDITVTGNVMSGTHNGITLWQDTSRTTQAICGAPSINNDKVTSNVETLSSGSGYTTGVYLYIGNTAPTGVVFSGNTYHTPDCGTGHWQWFTTTNTNQSFSSWRGIPEDASASCGP
jgi:parallel beta-helix repeat protein